jgi:hypothetical protein
MMMSSSFSLLLSSLSLRLFLFVVVFQSSPRTRINVSSFAPHHHPLLPRMQQHSSSSSSSSLSLLFPKRISCRKKDGATSSWPHFALRPLRSALASSFAWDEKSVTSFPFSESESSTSPSSLSNPRVGVLLLNLGGPEKEDDVEGTFFFFCVHVERHVVVSSTHSFLTLSYLLYYY